jgi:nucleoside-diphosphate-sugar epimerase
MFMFVALGDVAGLPPAAGPRGGLALLPAIGEPEPLLALADEELARRWLSTGTMSLQIYRAMAFNQLGRPTDALAALKAAGVTPGAQVAQLAALVGRGRRRRADPARRRRRRARDLRTGGQAVHAAPAGARHRADRHRVRGAGAARRGRRRRRRALVAPGLKDIRLGPGARAQLYAIVAACERRSATPTPRPPPTPRRTSWRRTARCCHDRTVVIGAGYTGGRVVAAATARGDEVVATRRRRARRARRRSDAAVDARRSVHARRSGDRHRAADRRSRHGERALVAAADRADVARIVYVSTTGVYAPAAGAWVDEDFAIAPTTAAGRARVAAEAALAAAAVSTVIVRARRHLRPRSRRRRPAARRQLPGDRRRRHRGQPDPRRRSGRGAPGLRRRRRARRRVYNVADDDPCPSAELADAAATALGLPPPPRVPLAAIEPETAGMLTADRRISAARLKRDLGWTPRFPTWRTALAAGLSWC